MKTKILLSLLILVLLAGCSEPPIVPDDPKEPPLNETYLTQEIMEDRALDIQALLSFNGINEAIVKVQEKEVIVRYNQPKVYSENDPFLHIGIIMASATTIHPEAEKITLQVFVEEEPITQIIINTNDFIAYRDKEINMDTFIKNWDLKEFN